MDWTGVCTSIQTCPHFLSFEVITFHGKPTVLIGASLQIRPNDLVEIMCNAKPAAALETIKGCFRLIKVEPEVICGLLSDLQLVIVRRDVWLFMTLLRRRASVAETVERVVSLLRDVVE